MDKLAAATDEMYSKLSEVGMTDEQIIAASRTLTDCIKQASWAGAATNLAKLPLLAAVGLPAGLGYAVARTPRGDSIDSEVSKMKAERRTSELLRSIDHLMRRRERQLNDAQGKL